MNAAAMPLGFVVDFEPGTANAGERFQMIPVGAAFVGGLFGSTGLQEVGGTTLPGNGIDTWSATLVPSPA